MRALSWEKKSLRLAIAIDSFIYFANVKMDHKYAFYGNTLAYVSGTETVTFWDTVTHQVNKLMFSWHALQIFLPILKITFVFYLFINLVLDK